MLPTRARVSIVLYLAVMVLGLVGCQSKPPDPREMFGLRDAYTSRSKVATAIEYANQILEGQSAFRLRASWQAKDSYTPVARDKEIEEIVVYLVRPKRHIPDVSDMEKAFAEFAKELDRTIPNPDAYDCSDADDCVLQLYGAQPILERTLRLLDAQKAVETAYAEFQCRCIVLNDGDLQVFEVLYSRLLSSDEIIPVEYYLVSVLLHEIGHFDGEFTLIAEGMWAKTYDRYYAALTPAQQEEARADAFTAVALRNACLYQTAPAPWDIQQTCLAMAIHPLKLLMFTVFAKTREGLCLSYLDPSDTHPNYYLRYTIMAMVMAEGDFVDLIDDFYSTREAILDKPWFSETETCQKLYWSGKKP